MIDPSVRAQSLGTNLRGNPRINQPGLNDMNLSRGNWNMNSLNQHLNKNRSPTPGMRNDVVPKGYKVGGLQQFDKPQTELYQRLLEYLGPDSFIAQLAQGNPELFNDIEAPAMQQFSELQGNIASRFSQGGGQGSLGGRKSSGFQNQQSSAASNFAQQLQAQRQGLQRQAQDDLMRYSHAMLAERPYEKGLFAKPGKEGGGSNLWKGLAGGLAGGAAGFFTGGGAGALPGALAGYNFGSNI